MAAQTAGHGHEGHTSVAWCDTVAPNISCGGMQARSKLDDRQRRLEGWPRAKASQARLGASMYHQLPIHISIFLTLPVPSIAPIHNQLNLEIT